MLDPGRSFSQANHHAHSFNPVVDHYGAKDYKVRARKIGQNHVDHGKWNSSADFGAGRSPQHRQNCYRSLSPSSRTEAIARGQKELMEMVNRMPEGCYELTLKDIVEQSMVDQVHDLGGGEKTVNEEKKINQKKVRVRRSESIDNGGFLLKMVLPVSWNSRNQSINNGDKKNKNDKIKKNDLSVVNSSGRVSSRALLYDGVKGGEDEWWKNRYEEKEESCEGGGLGSNGGSSTSRASSNQNNNGRQAGDGCWSIIFRKAGKMTDLD